MRSLTGVSNEVASEYPSIELSILYISVVRLYVMASYIENCEALIGKRIWALVAAQMLLNWC